MAILTAGALLMDREQGTGTMSDRLDGFLSLTWHGAHDGGSGAHRDADCTVYVVDEARGGQGELYFCSTDCLRQFLNRCVDELERRMAACERMSAEPSDDDGPRRR
ncbi:MAG: hypothetical protein AB1505_23615 [Candidatus Latescibacterota bacterium]